MFSIVDESIVNEDLVAWVMMGVLHVPRTEDVPLISNFGTQFFIKPWNYYDELVSMDMATTESFDAYALNVRLPVVIVRRTNL